MTSFDCVQSKNNDALTQYAETMRLRLGRPKEFKALNSNTVIFLRSTSRSFTHELYSYDISSNTESTLYTSDEILNGDIEFLTPEEKARRERLRLVGKGFSTFTLFNDHTRLLIPLSGKVYIVPTDRTKMKDIYEITSAAGGHDVTLLPNNNLISFTRNGSLYVTSIHPEDKDTPAKLLTPQAYNTDGTRISTHITYGTAEFCAQEEMSRFEGHWWTKSSDLVAYQKTDETAVELIYISDPSKPTQKPVEMKYPRAGTANPAVTISIAHRSNPNNFINISLSDVNDDEFTFEYLATMKWVSCSDDTNANYLVANIQNRPQTISKLVKYKVLTNPTDSTITISSPQVLITTRDLEGWINIDQATPRFILKNKAFIWSTEESGVPVIQLRSFTTGNLLGYITDNTTVYRSIVGYDEKAEILFYSASSNATNSLVYGVSVHPFKSIVNKELTDSNVKPLTTLPTSILLTPGRGVHAGFFLPTSIHKAEDIDVADATDATGTGKNIFIDVYENANGEFPVNVYTVNTDAFETTLSSTIATTTGLPDTFLENSIQQGDATTSALTLVGTIVNNAEMPISRVQFASIKVDLKNDGRSLHGTLLLPSKNASMSYDKNKKLPLMVYVYGGPGFATISSSPRSYTFHQVFADQGFAVLSVDGRGTPGRGSEWERCFKQDFITAPMHDQSEAVLALSRGDYSILNVSSVDHPQSNFEFSNIQNIVDFTKVGVQGWSFGGYFSAFASMLRPDIFKACISGAPVSDWTLYDTHYTERFIGFPFKIKDGKVTDEQTDVYINSNVNTHAKKMNSKLLITHGTADDNVVFGHATAMSDALFRAGKVHEFLPLTDFTHMVSDPSVNIALYSRFIHFFKTALE